MTHALYVAAAYGLSALGIAGVIVWILSDQAARKRELADLEKRGVRRRSAGSEVAQ
jgi:heme exporter protein D